MKGDAGPAAPAPEPTTGPEAACAAARPTPIAGIGPCRTGTEGAPIVVWTPRGPDSRVMIDALAEGGMPARAVGSAAEIALVMEEAGCVVVTQEALDAGAIDELGRALVDQPAWSELPILVLADRVADVFHLRAALEPAWGEAQVTFLTRPVAPLVLLTAAHAALAARMRQFLVRDQLDQEAELRRELNHRVKNILVTVQAMAKMTERSAGSDAGRFAAFQSRLAALASVHAMLFDASEEEARFEAVARAIMTPFGVLGPRGDGRVAIRGPRRALQPEAIKTLALAVHELATNALKYGALSGKAGRVELALDVEAERARLLWRESGGPPVTVPERRGYGTRYVVTALGGLFGTAPDLRYEPEGLVLEVEGPTEFLMSG